MQYPALEQRERRGAVLLGQPLDLLIRAGGQPELVDPGVAEPSPRVGDLRVAGRGERIEVGLELVVGGEVSPLRWPRGAAVATGSPLGASQEDSTTQQWHAPR
ncbi:MAG TPA: hypothetical protein VFQ77_17260 [Pseudonocardiaceae bacterium]|nr:hypothetical protein [Pseudonocardiaceae bacterium]